LNNGTNISPDATYPHEWKETLTVQSSSSDNSPEQVLLDIKFHENFVYSSNWIIGRMMKPFLINHHLQSIQHHCDKIMTIVRTHDINIALMACFNPTEFMVSNPLRDFQTDDLYDDKAAASKHMAFGSMALLAQFGIAYFDLDKLKKFKRAKRQYQKGKNKDKDTEPEMIETQCGYNNVLTKLALNQVIPTTETLHKFFHDSFLAMEDKTFTFLQSVLKDLWCLQPFTRPYDYKETQGESELELSLQDKRHDKDKEEEDTTPLGKGIYQVDLLKHVSGQKVTKKVPVNGSSTPKSPYPSLSTPLPSDTRSSNSNKSKKSKYTQERTPSNSGNKRGTYMVFEIT
jgi:hypothetical protein